MRGNCWAAAAADKDIGANKGQLSYGSCSIGSALHPNQIGGGDMARRSCKRINGDTT